MICCDARYTQRQIDVINLQNQQKAETSNAFLFLE